MENWREEFKRRVSDGADKNPDTFDRAFRRARDKLHDHGLVGFYDNEAWLIWDSRT